MSRIYEELKSAQNLSGSSARTDPGATLGFGAFLEWHDSKEQVTVRFSLPNVQLLERDLIRTKAPELVGGLLLGKRDESQTATVTVEYYAPLLGVSGVSGTSPLSDLPNLAALIDHWNSKLAGRMEIVGLYRSCLPGGCALNSEDLEALKTASISERSIFLVLEPSVGKPFDAHLFLLRGHNVLVRWKPQRFTRPLPRRKQSEPQAQAQISTDSSDSESETDNLSNPERSERSSFKDQLKKQRSPVWAVGAFALVLFLALSAYRVFIPSHPQTVIGDNGNLGLKLTRDGSDWRLNWNSDSPLFRSDRKGRLIVDDGPLRKQIELDSSDLRGGAIVYSASTNDVVFRLQVDPTDSEPAASESVRITGSLPSPLAFISDSLRNSGSRSEKNASTTPQRSAAPAVVPAPDAPHKSADIGKAPAGIVAGPSPASPLLLSAETKRRSSPSLPPEVSANLETAPILPVAATPYPGEVSETDKVVPAQLIHRQDPVYPASIAHFEGQVELRFSITKDGMVGDVHVVKGNPVLARAATDAVKMWRYEPARLNGKPVEAQSSAVINFK